MWKFHAFAITEIFRENNFAHSRNAKSGILTHLQALNFDFHEFLHFQRAVIYQSNHTWARGKIDIGGSKNFEVGGSKNFEVGGST